MERKKIRSWNHRTLTQNGNIKALFWSVFKKYSQKPKERKYQYGDVLRDTPVVLHI